MTHGGRLATLLVGLAAGIAACGGATAPDLDDAGGDVDVAAGAELYAANCAVCHGEDLRGTGQGPPFLHEVYEPSHHGDAAFQLAVARGVPAHHWDFGPMPAIGGLSEDEVADITAHVREQQRAVGIE